MNSLLKFSIFTLILTALWSGLFVEVRAMLITEELFQIDRIRTGQKIFNSSISENGDFIQVYTPNSLLDVDDNNYSDVYTFDQKNKNFLSVDTLISGNRKDAGFQFTNLGGITNISNDGRFSIIKYRGEILQESNTYDYGSFLKDRKTGDLSPLDFYNFSEFKSTMSPNGLYTLYTSFRESGARDGLSIVKNNKQVSETIFKPFRCDSQNQFSNIIPSYAPLQISNFGDIAIFSTNDECVLQTDSSRTHRIIGWINGNFYEIVVPEVESVSFDMRSVRSTSAIVDNRVLFTLSARYEGESSFRNTALFEHNFITKKTVFKGNYSEDELGASQDVYISQNFLVSNSNSLNRRNPKIRIINFRNNQREEVILDYSVAFNNGSFQDISGVSDRGEYIFVNIYSLDGESSKMLRLKNPLYQPKEPQEIPTVLVHGIVGNLGQAWNQYFVDLDIQDPDSPLEVGFPEVNLSLKLDKACLRGTRFDRDLLGRTWCSLADWSNIEGYLQGKDKPFYRYSYDWTQGNQTNLEDLDTFIEAVKTTEGVDKVNLVAYSNGGLLTRGYLDQFQGSDSVNKVAYITSPLYGTESAVGAWHGGNLGFVRNFAAPWQQTIIDAVVLNNSIAKNIASGTSWKLILAQEVVPEATGAISKLFPVIRDLMAVYDGARQEVSLNNSLWGDYSIQEILSVDDNPYTQSYYLDDQIPGSVSEAEKIDTLFVESGVTPTEYQSLFLSDNLSNQSQWLAFQEPFNKWKIQSSGLSYLYYDETLTAGDGVVPQPSMAFSCNWIGDTCVTDGGADWQKEYVDELHVDSVAASGQLVADWLYPDVETGEVVVAEPIEAPEGKTGMIYIGSPIDPVLILPDGTRLDKDTPLSVFDEKEISFISYGSEGKKFFFIDTVDFGEYEVELVGNNNGDYTLGFSVADQTDSVRYAVTGEIENEEVISYTIEVPEEDLIELPEQEPEEVIQPKNTAPTATLDSEIYSGVELDTIIFDGSGSSDPEGDVLEYRWTLKGLYTGEWGSESILEYTFDQPYQGVVKLEVRDAEFEVSTEAEVVIEELVVEDRLSEIRSRIESLSEDTSYIRSKKQLWLQLIDIAIQYTENDSIQDIVLDLLERDIVRSLSTDEQWDNMVSWWQFWQPQDLITDGNEEILRGVLELL